MPAELMKIEKFIHLGRLQAAGLGGLRLLAGHRGPGNGDDLGAEAAKKSRKEESLVRDLPMPRYVTGRAFF